MENNRKSWLEIDKMRDKGNSRRVRRSSKSTLERALEDPRLREHYLQQAERLFMGAKGKPDHAKDLQAIHEAYGAAEFEAAVQNYIEKYGMPEDWSTLLLLLDTKNNPVIVCKSISILTGLSSDKGTVERKGLKSKLEVMSLTTKDYHIRETAEQYLSELN
jgi:hypothetical protein